MKTASIWIRVSFLLALVWLLINGARPPEVMPVVSLDAISLAVGVTLSGGLLFAAGLFGYALTSSVGPPLGWSIRSGRAVGSTVACVLGLSVAAEGLISGAGWAEGSDVGNLQRLVEGVDLSTRLGLAVVMAVLPSLSEEFFFRGWLLSRLRSVCRPEGAVVLSAVIFGLFHFDVVRALGTTAVGLGLAYSVVRFGTLGPAAMAHAINNFLGVTVPSLGGVSAGHEALKVGLGLVLAGLGAWAMPLSPPPKDGHRENPRPDTLASS